ncbi:MAG: DUF3027 domain-containing protein [bacterium]
MKLQSKTEKSQIHFADCHRRWLTQRNRKQEAPSYKDEWYGQQCGACVFFIPLSGVFAEDYGACSNQTSKFDGMIRFEHDGCDAFKSSRSL